MFEIVNDQVNSVEQVPTGTQIATVKKLFGLVKKVSLAASKTNLTLNEVAVITAKWQKFDLSQGKYIDDNSNSSDIAIESAGAKIVTTPINGVATIDFVKEDVGTYNIICDGNLIKMIVA